MKNPSGAVARRDTGIWKLTGKYRDRVSEEASPPEKLLDLAEITVGPDQNNGTIEFGGIRVKLVTYRTIPGVILINAAKTMSEWMKLRALNHPNIIGFDDEDSGTGHWLPTTTEGMSDDPEGQCELYIMRPPLPVSVAAAAAQYPFSIMDAHRMCKDLLNALKYLASHKLLRGDFDANHVIVTREGFKLANIHLCEDASPHSEVKDLQSVGKILRDTLVGRRQVPKAAEWSDFYHSAVEELVFAAYTDTLSRMLLLPWHYEHGQYEEQSQQDRLGGVAYEVHQKQRNTFQW